MEHILRSVKMHSFWGLWVVTSIRLFCKIAKAVRTLLPRDTGKGSAENTLDKQNLYSREVTELASSGGKNWGLWVSSNYVYHIKRLFHGDRNCKAKLNFGLVDIKIIDAARCVEYLSSGSSESPMRRVQQVQEGRDA